jgi:hypothetical protein
LRNLCAKESEKFEIVKIDFDLRAVFFIQEVGNLGAIPEAVPKVLNTFQRHPPETQLQWQVHQAAIYLNQVLERYQQNPNVKPPFCLRYTNPAALLRLAQANLNQCKMLPAKAVILLDESEVCIGIGLPPCLQGNEGYDSRDVSLFFTQYGLDCH